MTNQLFYGDNLQFIRQHMKDESVDLCYIDPPFNSKRNYSQIYNKISLDNKAQARAFIDIWTWDDFANDGFCQIMDNHQGRFTAQTIALIAGLSNVLGESSLLAYLVSITLRVAEIHRVLKPTGSLYLHCDPTASHYIKLVIDAVFCSKGGIFQNEIIWCYSIGGKSQKRFGRKHDVLFYYTKSDEYTFNIKAASIPRKPNHMKVRVDSAGREYQEKTDRRTGNVYRYYLDEGKIAEDYWTDIETLNREDRERRGYPTQKPEALLERIIKVSTKEGDVVLDAYCGCGTTVAVAQRLNRQWIGIDITYQSISLILKRLEETFGSGILNQVELSGIPKNMESAAALANRKDERTRKEFEKWAVLTYSNNHAIINQKKGADKGIEGIVYFLGTQGEQEKIIIEVRAGHVQPGDIRDLHDTMSQEQAAMAIFITLKEPTSEMLEEATCGIYQHKVIGRSYPRIQIVTIREMLEEGKRLDIPLSMEVLKAAK